MKKIDIYIIKKFLGTFFYAISLLIMIVIIFDISEKIDDFLNNDAPLREILFSYYLNFIPYFINLFSYLFVFISVIYFTSHLASRSEIIAILSSGISFNRLMWPYLFSAVLLGLLSFYMANFLIPHTNKRMLEFEKVYIKNPYKDHNLNIHMQIEPGVFIYLESFSNRSKTGHKFTLEEFRNGEMLYKLMAERISWDSVNGRWMIRNYIERRFNGVNEWLGKGTELDTLINLTPDDFAIAVEDIKTMNYMELRRFIEKEKLKGSEIVKSYEVEKHKRFADPFSTLILTLIGVSLSSRKVRGGIGMQLGFGIGITFSFILFMQVSTVFATIGNLSPALAAWIPNMIFGTLAIFLIRFAPK